MPQISVPTSIRLFGPNFGITSVEPINSPSLWEAVDEPGNHKYIENIASPSEDFTQILVDFYAQALDDPLVNFDHGIRIVYRSTIANLGNGGFGFFAESINEEAAFSFSVPWADTGGLFVEFFHPLTEAEVIQFRAAGGYTNLTLGYYIILGEDGSAAIDVSYYIFEAPDSNPLIHEFTGDAILEFDADSDVEPRVIVSEVILEIDGASSEVMTNEIIGDAILELDAESFVGGNSIEGDVTLEFDASAILVLSVDVSGLYTFTPGKPNDTLYQRDSDQTSLVVKIPDPLFKTTFVGG